MASSEISIWVWVFEGPVGTGSYASFAGPIGLATIEAGIVAHTEGS